jgi:Ras GTPase-activating-like protein IQGAP2/3
MPNFGDVGRDLAKEINEEPEVEVETEEERASRCLTPVTVFDAMRNTGCDRLLLENEGSIIGMQSIARGHLVRRAQSVMHQRMRNAERHIRGLQAHCRGSLARRELNALRRERAELAPWVRALQATARAVLARRRWSQYLRQIRASVSYMVEFQAQARGYILRRRLAKFKAALRSSTVSVVQLQSRARARITRNVHHELKKVVTQQFGHVFIALQAQCRGVIMRRRMRAQMAKLEDVTHVVIRIQAAARTYLARKRLLGLIRGLRKATPVITGLQARARAKLARQHHESLSKALATVQVATSVGGFQARARAALTRKRHREHQKRIEFFVPDVVGFQAVSRGALVRVEYRAWRDHLWRSQPVVVLLQAMLRGLLLRRKFRQKLEYYQDNLHKVVKIQSLFRAKETREQYLQLTLGKNVTVGTIKNFVHLLDDSEADFQEEIRVERLRKRVVEGIRENQALESEISELDVKIALVVQNAKSFEELIKVRRRHGADSAAAHAARASVLAAHGDPFAGPNTLDHAAKRKLELYQQLFYLLQTKEEYLCRLFNIMSRGGATEKNRRLTEQVVLTLFGYGQDRREHYLLLKLLQVIHICYCSGLLP